MNSDNIDTAIVLYTGKGDFNFPHQSFERVIEHFPGPEGIELARRIEELETDFYKVRPRPNEGLVEASDRAAQTFAGNHPELSENAVDAPRWCFAFDWK